MGRLGNAFDDHGFAGLIDKPASEDVLVEMGSMQTIK